MPYPSHSRPLVQRNPELICWDCEESHPLTPNKGLDEKEFNESLDLFRWVHSGCEGRNYG